ncbi:MAG: hypothetical protein ACR2JT_04975 [Nocardioidaceae bacterium]
MDRQIVDPDGALVAKVDEVELTEDGMGGLLVTALLTGPGVLGPRLRGGLGQSMFAIWRRLHRDAEPLPGRIAISDVVKLDSAVHVGRQRAALNVDGLEEWVRNEIVSRLPGASHEPE